MDAAPSHASTSSEEPSPAQNPQPYRPDVMAPADGADPELARLLVAYVNAGQLLLPICPQTKKPPGRWKFFKDVSPLTRPSVENTLLWYQEGYRTFACISGPVSGNVRGMDFDRDADQLFPSWMRAVLDKLGSIAEQLVIVRSGNRQNWRCRVLFRWAGPPDQDPGKGKANVVLAHKRDDTDPNGKVTSIECQWNGQPLIVAGSVHPSGGRYEAIAGDPLNPPLLTTEQVKVLFQTARDLDEPSKNDEQHAYEQAKRDAGNDGPGDTPPGRPVGLAAVTRAFNRKFGIRQTLERYGYHQVKENHYSRPGGDKPTVIAWDDTGRSYHHNTNDPLHYGREVAHRTGARTAFDLYCWYEHHGDVARAVTAAAKELGIDANAGQSENRPPVAGARTISEILDDPSYDAGFQTITTGFSDIDRFMPLRSECFYVVGARTGTGKTTFVVNASRRIAAAGYRVCVFKLEESGRELVYRLHAAEGKVPLDVLLDRRIPRDPLLEQLIRKARQTIRDLPVVVSEARGIDDLEHEAKVQVAKGAKVIFIDQASQLSVPNADLGFEAISLASGRLRMLAKQIQVPIVLVSQVNREASKKSKTDTRLSIHDLRDSGMLENDAAGVLLIDRADPPDGWEPESGLPGILTMHVLIAKNRYGPAMAKDDPAIQLKWHVRSGRVAQSWEPL